MSSRLDDVTIRKTLSSRTCHAHHVPTRTTATVTTRNVTVTPTGSASVLTDVDPGGIQCHAGPRAVEQARQLGEHL